MRGVRIGGVIVYNPRRHAADGGVGDASRGSLPEPDRLQDGLGDVRRIVQIRHRVGDRLVYIGGMPTHGGLCQRLGAGCTDVFVGGVQLHPQDRHRVLQRLRQGDQATVGRLINEFFLPYLDIRNRGEGYAVSIVKAGATIVGRGAGPVRPPLTDLKPEEVEQLRALIQRLGPQ